MSERIQSYGEFLPYYLREHSHPTSRGLHYIGTLVGSCVVFYFAASETPYLFPLGFLFGYFCAWVGHFGFEKNKPATFKYPLWSFISDYVMLFYFLTGQIDHRMDEAHKAAVTQT